MSGCSVCGSGVCGRLQLGGYVGLYVFSGKIYKKFIFGC